MLFRLCATGMAAHPDELRDRLDARQIADWLAYSQIEPFGSQHDELLHAIRAAMFANANRPKDSEPHEITEFMPSWVQPEMDWRQIRRNLTEWQIVHGARSET